MCEKVVLASKIGLVFLAMRNSGIGAFSYNGRTLEVIHDDSLKSYYLNIGLSCLFHLRHSVNS